MISRITGRLAALAETRALVETGGIHYEVMLPSALADRLKKNDSVGETITFETIYYIEAGEKKASHYPKLVGFTDPVDREFFSLLTQVSGLGVKKALKSLTLPIREIAYAIETKDAGTLSRLPGVGGRLAEKIIAELHGKTARFALSKGEEALAAKDAERPSLQEDALEVLMQLQYGRQEAGQMIAAALRANPGINCVEKLIEVIFRSERESKVTDQV